MTTSTKTTLTARQQNIVDVITKTQSNTKGAITQEAMAKKLNISQNTFSEHITRLVDKNAIKVYRTRDSATAPIKFYEIV